MLNSEEVITRSKQITELVNSLIKDCNESVTIDDLD